MQVVAKKEYIKDEKGNYIVPYVNPANINDVGVVKPDGETITIDKDGKISAIGSGGLPIGVVLPTIFPIDESKGLQRYLNGSIMDINANTKAFVDKLKSAVELYPSLVCTEEEWQTISAVSVGGQCGKFVIDEENGTVRLPKIIMPIQGLTDLSKLGDLIEAGLPNITGSFVFADNIVKNASGANYVLNVEGAFSAESYTSNTCAATNAVVSNVTSTNRKVNFSAQDSNPIYNNSYTVQQEQIQYPYFIQVATGVEYEVNIKNEIELNNPYSFGDSKYMPYKLDEIESENISWLISSGQYNPKAPYEDYYNWILKNVNKGTKYFKSDMAYAYNGSINCWFPVEKPIVGAWAYSTTNGEPIGRVETVNADGSLVVNGSTVNPTGGGNAGESLFTDYDFVLNQANNTFRLPLKTRLASRLETFDEGLYLYFYVGETVQNANLIDVAKITEGLTTKTNAAQAAHASMPSDKYVDLTLGATGTSYTAPADGWVVFTRSANTASKYIGLEDTYGVRWQMCWSPTNSTTLSVFMPVKKGATFKAVYTAEAKASAGNSSTGLRFYYATGTESEAE